MCARMASIFFTTSCIRGHHVYKSAWTPTLGEELECRRGDNNFERYAVAVIRRGVVVKHIPGKKIKQWMNYLCCHRK